MISPGKMAHFQDESSNETGLESAFGNLSFKPRSSSSRCSSHDEMYKLPSSTSNWDMIDLEAVGVYYDREFKSVSTILDMIHDHTGMFAPLTENQKEGVKSCQDRITMSSSVDEIFLKGGQVADLCLDTITPHLQKRVMDQFISMREDFIRNIVVMVKRAVEKDKKGNVTEAVFVDIFKSFVKMCGLLPISGDEWRSTIKILHQEVTTAADIVIQSEDYLHRPDSITAVSIVSIVEVKNMTYHKSIKSKLASKTTEERQEDKRIPVRKASSKEGESLLHEEPLIFKRIKKRVLAQHGGELLLHRSIYSRKFVDKERQCYLLPGMIVIGTQVTFTLLEYNFDHVEEVEHNSVVEASRSYIYYSEPKDLLKKEDRDLLMESFARLCNRI